LFTMFVPVSRPRTGSDRRPPDDDGRSRRKAVLGRSPAQSGICWA